MFIHVAIQNCTTIRRAQDNSWTTDHFGPIVLYVWPLWLEIHCFSIMSWPLSWLIVSTAYWSNRK